jgi:hypothetical protein
MTDRCNYTNTTKASRMQNNSAPPAEKRSIRNALVKWLPALITGLILGFALVLFSHRP